MISLKQLRTRYKIYKNLLEYLNIHLIQKGRSFYIEDNHLETILSFKKEHGNMGNFFRKKTFLEKYGVENPMQNKDVHNRMVDTVMRKYGVTNISVLENVKNKKINTLQEHYGKNVKNPMDVCEVVQNIKDVWENKSVEEKSTIVEKVKKSKFEKYGDVNYNNPSQISITRNNRTAEEKEREVQNIKKIKLERYGDENYRNDVKRKKTLLKKYGVENPLLSEDVKNRIKSEKQRILKELVENENLYSISEVSEIVGRDYSTILDDIVPTLNIHLIEKSEFNIRLFVSGGDVERIKKYCAYTENVGTSWQEKEVQDFVIGLVGAENVVCNDRNVLNGKELDIYVPSKKVAIEYDGLRWHSEQFVENDYHYNKMLMCNDKNVDLIHVFEDDWKKRKDIVKSIIASRLGIYNRKIFARKCDVRNVEEKDAKDFFKANHLQGYAKCDIRLGLYHNDEPVQMICVKLKGFHDGNVELTRMVTAIDTQVTGGFSRLMTNLCKEYNVDRIVSYVYRAWFNGKGYSESGFKIVSEIKPSYSYIFPYNNRVHKSRFRKKTIRKYYNDGIFKYYSENESEHQNMLKNGVYRIYDCGLYKVEYKNK